MSKQPEALRLAEACEQAATIADMGRPPIASDWRRLSAAELRRLHRVNADLLSALQAYVSKSEPTVKFIIPEA